MTNEQLTAYIGNHVVRRLQSIERRLDALQELLTLHMADPYTIADQQREISSVREELRWREYEDYINRKEKRQ